MLTSQGPSLVRMKAAKLYSRDVAVGKLQFSSLAPLLHLGSSPQPDLQ